MILNLSDIIGSDICGKLPLSFASSTDFEYKVFQQVLATKGVIFEPTVPASPTNSVVDLSMLRIDETDPNNCVKVLKLLHPDLDQYHLLPISDNQLGKLACALRDSPEVDANTYRIANKGTLNFAVFVNPAEAAICKMLLLDL